MVLSITVSLDNASNIAFSDEEMGSFLAQIKNYVRGALGDVKILLDLNGNECGQIYFANEGGL